MYKIFLFALAFLISTHAIRIGDVIEIKNLVGNGSKFNGEQAKIISIERGTTDLKQFRYGVQTLNESKQLAIKRDNISGGTERLRGEVEQKSMDEILADMKMGMPMNNWKKQLPITEAEAHELRTYYAPALRSMTPEEWLDRGDNEGYARSIGFEIDQNFGFIGMVFVADEIFEHKERQFIERAWDGVGVWLA